jgi:tRNA 2-thiouridine synthesizing protein A
MNVPANSQPPHQYSNSQYLDLRGVPCPLSFVKAKLRLERIESGQILELWLDLGEPVEQVPNSLKVDGHKILSLTESLVEREAKFFTLVVQKV